MIVTLSGVTGTGKSFFKNVISQELNFKNLVIVTTRNKRTGEINGVDKEFVSEEEFERLKKENKIDYDVLIASAVINGRVPEIYGGLIQSKSNSLSIPIE